MIPSKPAARGTSAPSTSSRLHGASAAAHHTQPRSVHLRASFCVGRSLNWYDGDRAAACLAGLTGWVVLALLVLVLAPGCCRAAAAAAAAWRAASSCLRCFALCSSSVRSTFMSSSAPSLLKLTTPAQQQGSTRGRLARQWWRDAGLGWGAGGVKTAAPAAGPRVMCVWQAGQQTHARLLDASLLQQSSCESNGSHLVLLLPPRRCRQQQASSCTRPAAFPGPPGA